MRSALLIASLAVLAAGSPCTPQPKFDYLVTFGDSYTDDGWLNYYVAHGSKPPPPGSMQPQTNDTAGGGYTWTQDVANDTGATNYDYAVNGATCSNAIISRYFSSINAPFPDILGTELPTFKSDLGTRLYAHATPENTVYAVWIGTNDLGWEGFLSDSQAPGTNISTYVDCVWSVFDAIYEAGGRRFVLLNTNALHLVPMYAPTDAGGAGDNQYWSTKTLYNTTEYAYKMREYTTTVNTVFEYGVPFHLLVGGRWPGARFGLFDVHALLTEMYYHPEAYLEPPYNVTGFYHHCNTEGADCSFAPGSIDSYLWFDELHPSARTDITIAKEFEKVVGGVSAYGRYYNY